MISSKPSSRRAPFGTRRGANEASRSPGHLYRHRPDVGGQRLGREPVAGVRRPAAHRAALRIAKVVVHLHRQAPLQHRFDQLGQQAALTGQGHAPIPGPGDCLINQRIGHQRPTQIPSRPGSDILQARLL